MIAINDTCPGVSIDTSYYNATQSIYSMVFITGQSKLPVVNFVSAQNLTLNSEITVAGNRFSSRECDNQILIGGVICPLLSSSVNLLICQLSDDSRLMPNILYQIEVLVKNIGYAIHNGRFQVEFSSIVTAVSSQLGKYY